MSDVGHRRHYSKIAVDVNLKSKVAFSNLLQHLQSSDVPVQSIFSALTECLKAGIRTLRSLYIGLDFS
jgi:hypothetical protein